uniref:Exostosin GT47 domain-containing protein n=1 Tax=viral metagenome TaxID=1070528 RepID=A0A6C0K0K2_9ZZZZ
MEQLCYFVCSRGLLKSCTFHSLKPTSSCNNDIVYLGKMITSEKMRDGMSIYVCSNLLRFFVLQILPKISNTFILVTGDSDMCVPKESLTESETISLINNPHLLKWFAQNTQIQRHEKIVQLPIGLDYHTISNDTNHNWKTEGEGHLPKDQEGILINLRQQMAPFYERNPIIYVNFTPINDKFGQRKTAFEQIPNDLLFINQNFTKRTENWKNITQNTFVLSPFGMGMDCHRTWEALCLGAIPIVKAPNFQKMFEDLPVLIVNEWSEITQELLDKTIKEFKTREFKYEKLTLQYWVKMINDKL